MRSFRSILGLVLGSLSCLALVTITWSADLAPAPGPETTTNVELLRRLEALEKQNKLLAQRVSTLEAAQAQGSAQTQAQDSLLHQQARVVAAAEQRAPVPMAPDPATSSAGESATSVGGYGELNYTRPSRSPSDANVDVARAVILLHHDFDAKTRFNGEFEWEHAITSSSDSGEAEVEQLWIERELSKSLNARAGLFLMPVGLVNEHHEPTAFYGVQRPEVDTKIVPSTWREVGFGVTGGSSNSLGWELALTTAPNLSKWDPSSSEGLMRGPLQSIHGEGQFASFADFGVVGALSWRGVPGLLIGGSAYYAGLGQHQPGFQGNGAKLLFLDAHARYEVAGWDFAGEYERGSISHAGLLNSSFVNAGIEGPTFVPHVFFGGYLQAAYRVWESRDYSLSPFVRYEILNTASAFDSLSAAAGAVASPNEHIWTIGASFRIGEGVVVKTDYRHYQENPYPDADHFNLGTSFNLGLGFSF